MSGPTICLLFFPPNSPIAAPLLQLFLQPARSSASPGRLAHLPFHPAVQNRFPQFPAVAKFKRGYFAFRNVAVQRIRADTQILRRLSHVHYFARFHHSGTPPRHSNTRQQVTIVQVRPIALQIGIEGTTRVSFMTLCTPSVKGIYRSVALSIRVVLGLS